MNDIKSIVFDEIALEGLEGITIKSLWVRLAQRSDLQFNLDHASSKDYIWRHVILKFACKNLQFYKLPHNRAVIKIYNRYNHISEETGYCISNEDQIPDDLSAEICPINENNERGSCKYYNEREPVTLEQLNKMRNVKQVLDTFDDKLVIVASQLLREMSLRINHSDPHIELTPIQYCVLECVGRGRTLGEVTFGKESANFKEPPKTLFYFRKLLLSKNLITKQNHSIYNTKTLSITRGLLLMLPRFHIDRISRIELASQKIFEILKTMPDHKCEYVLLRTKLKIKPKAFKHVFSEFPKNFRVYEKDIEKNNRKYRARFVQLTKNLKETGDDEGDIESDSDDFRFDDLETTNDKQSTNKNESFNNKVKLFAPDNISMNRSLLSQSYKVVESYSMRNGCSLREFQNELIVPRLDARMLVRMLERLDEVTSISTNIGRQKIIRYFLKCATNQTVTAFNNENNQLDLGKKATLVTLKRANLILNAVKEHKIIDQMVHFKKIILEAEKNQPYLVDQKSVKTIVAALAKEGHLTWVKRTIEKNNQLRELNLVCIPSIKEDDEIIKERIKQAKFNSFSAGHPGQDTKDSVFNPEWFNINMRNDEAELVYQPSAGRKYGLEPKMKRLLLFYKFIFFTLSKECREENKHDDWRKHITPLPKSYEKDICALGDLVPRMPLSIFVKVIFITYIIPGLDDVLKDPIRCNYTLQMLPTDIVKNLFRKRKYLFSMVELLTSLAHLNLVEVKNKLLQLKETVSIKLLRTTQFREDDYVKNYRLENMDDVELFAQDLALHSSRMDCKNCSFDSRLYVHNTRNWSYLPKLHRNLELREIRRFTRLRSVMDELQMPDATAPGINKSPTSSSTAKDSVKRKSTARRPSKRKRSQKDPAKAKVKSQTDASTKKIRKSHYDKEDMNALSMMRKQRSEWSKEEDSFLLMCRVASVILHPTSSNFVCVSKTLVRDELHKYLPQIAFDKTSKACQRRIMYMLKNPRTRAHVLDWVAECKQDPEFSNITKPNVPLSHEEEWNTAYNSLLHKLLTKFQNEHFISPSKVIENFTSLDEIYKKYNLIASEIHCVPQKPILYYQPNNIVDIYVNVVLNVIASSLLMNLFEYPEEYVNRSTLALFKIYQRFPDTMLRSVMTKMKANGMMAKMRDSDRIKLKNKNKKLELYKISQHYCWVLKSRYSMDTLSVPLEIKDDLMIDNFRATELALAINLITLSRARFEIVIPENFITYKEAPNTKLDSSTIANGNKDLNNNLELIENSQNTNETTFIDQTISWSDLHKRASRYLLCGMRQKMDLVLNRPLQTEQDFIVLNKCSVTCRLTSSVDLVDLNEFRELIEKKNVFIEMNDGETSNDIHLNNNLERLIVKEVTKTKELGLNVKHLTDVLSNKKIEIKLLEPTVRQLCDRQVIFEVGVEELRLVSRKFVYPWLVQVHQTDSCTYDDHSDHALSSQTIHRHSDHSTMSSDDAIDNFSGKSGTIDDQVVDKNAMETKSDDQLTAISDISTETNATMMISDENNASTFKKPKKLIFFQPRFWKNPFGELDKRVMVTFLSGIAGHVMANPGILIEDLINYFKFCSSPVQTIEFMDLLVAANCVQKKKLEMETNHTLFGPTTKQTLIYFEPSKNCFLTVCAIKSLFDRE